MRLVVGVRAGRVAARGEPERIGIRPGGSPTGGELPEHGSCREERERGAALCVLCLFLIKI